MNTTDQAMGGIMPNIVVTSSNSLMFENMKKLIREVFERMFGSAYAASLNFSFNPFAPQDSRKSDVRVEIDPDQINWGQDNIKPLWRELRCGIVSKLKKHGCITVERPSVNA